MKTVFYLLVAVLLILSGYLGGKLFDKPQVVNNFTFQDSKVSPQNTYMSNEVMKIKSEYKKRDEKLLKIIKQIDASIDREIKNIK